MRKLRGGTTKETKKDKLQRRKDMQEIPDQVKRIVLPTLAAVVAGLVVLLYFMTRPSSIPAS
uniref:Hypotheticial protein n=1 Tax=Schistosoma japonicum TaxID=6182 RepID=C1LM20_SCHJA|nr:hypotheticial protein [Schistosoma japonicum]CAX75748.1 hypotheticial protein [Schistosoma japonicum]